MGPVATITVGVNSVMYISAYLYLLDSIFRSYSQNLRIMMQQFCPPMPKELERQTFTC